MMYFASKCLSAYFAYGNGNKFCVFFPKNANKVVRINYSNFTTFSSSLHICHIYISPVKIIDDNDRYVEGGVPHT